MANLNPPIINAPSKYVTGLFVTQTGTGILGISPGGARNSTNVSDMVLPTFLNFPITNKGVNGLDAGVATVNTFYATYLIGDSNRKNEPAGLFSLNTTTPLLPAGYDMFRRIGWFRTHSSNPALISRTFPYGEGENRVYYVEEPVTILTAGNATSYTQILPASLGAAPALSAGANIGTELLVKILFTPASATNVVDFGFTNAIPAPLVSFGTGVAGLQVGSIRIPTSTNSAFRYKVTNAGDSVTLLVTGFVDYLF